MCNKVTLFEDTSDPEAESCLFVATEILKLAIDNQIPRTEMFCLTGITSKTHLLQIVYMRDAQALMNALSALSNKYQRKTSDKTAYDLNAYKSYLNANYGPNAEAD